MLIAYGDRVKTILLRLLKAFAKPAQRRRAGDVAALSAILLLLGTGTDYSILLLLALKRNGGDVPGARRELGLVIFLCASSAAAGFGSLAWAGNLGLASLGQTCALGLLIDAIISLFLLPRAWSFPKKTSSSL